MRACSAFIFLVIASTRTLANFNDIDSDKAAESIKFTEARATIIFFTAVWAGPARKMEPSIRLLGRQPDLNVYQVNVDNAPELVKKFDVKLLPHTFIFDRKGTKLGSVTGVKPGEVEKILENAK